jgi:hypothetical protein
VDIRIGADAGLTPLRNERRDHARDDHSGREVSPGVIVEIGGRPVESAGTYSARGVLEGTTPIPKPGAAPVPGAPTPAERTRVESPRLPAGPLGMPETLRLPGNVQIQTMAGASPQVALALRAGLPTEAAHLHPPALALTAGIQTLATNALKQTEKGHATQEHDEETDPLRKEKDAPLRDRGRRRGR